VVVEEMIGENILHYEQFLHRAAEVQLESAVTLMVPITEPKPPQYIVRLVSDNWLSSETLLAVSLRHLILPEKTSPHKKLLDLQPLPKRVLRHKDAVEMLCPDISSFNPIQPQTFSPLCQQQTNCLIRGAPAASGKEVCMENPLLRMVHRAAGVDPQLGYTAGTTGMDMQQQQATSIQQRTAQQGCGAGQQRARVVSSAYRGRSSGNVQQQTLVPDREPLLRGSSSWGSESVASQPEREEHGQLLLRARWIEVTSAPPPRRTVAATRRRATLTAPYTRTGRRIPDACRLASLWGSRVSSC
jgi:hypothetical protein